MCQKFVEENDLVNETPTPALMPELELYNQELGELYRQFDRLPAGNADQDAVNRDMQRIRRLLQDLAARANHPGNNSNNSRSSQGRMVQIDSQHLRNLLRTGSSLSGLARAGTLGTHCRKTLANHCRKEGIPLPRERYTTISDQALRDLVSGINVANPNAGQQEVRSRLEENHHIFIPRARVRSMMREVDPVGTAARWAQVTERRRYHVPGANSFWHVDNNHALKRWKIWVHGGIDGFSRLIPFLVAASNNEKETSLRVFLDGIRDFAFPSRVRADGGAEFNALEQFIRARPGGLRSRLIRGKSTHNQRIERLWRDVFSKVLDRYYRLFYILEDDLLLDVEDPIHMYCLHLVYLPIINRELMKWTQAHNNQGVRTANSKKPNNMWYSSMREQTCGQQATSAAGWNVQNFNLEEHFETILEDYHIDLTRPPLVFPRFPNPVADNDISEILLQVDLFTATDGVEEYVTVLEFILQRLEENRQNHDGGQDEEQDQME